MNGSQPATGVPILRLGDVLVTGLLNELDDKTAVAFTDELTRRITSDEARGVLIDVSRLEIIDSFVARTLMELSTVARLLGARVIVAGVRPPVAITLVELGIQLTGVETALNAEQGMAALGWYRTTAGQREGERWDGDRWDGEQREGA
ncbi:STAS domain-containing protein [Streptomyces sp. MST-110588]|uniref:STAS domain-containing protein n=1 Tax=Streptomyces sp. MST-110588 TaxID=2833628 RepID=UPI001F5CC3A0|nr:STAS domain-containing protein [Streptomyces sp. MST-110588]UNO41085.1 STAS domain-containing protein [Streptomyces sp. MST-110588]